MTTLPPDRWPEVEALYQAVLASPPGERDGLLEAADPAVAEEVRGLLAVEDAAESFFGEPSGMGTLLGGVGAEGFEEVLSGPGGPGAGGPGGGPDLAAAVRAAVAEAADDLQPGARVGPWEVGAEVGRGGMGAVYRARRADGAYEQTVALKVVKRGMDSAAVLRRFAQERALLAGLEHDGIARLLDGGTAADGRPYLALELSLIHI